MGLEKKPWDGSQKRRILRHTRFGITMWPTDLGGENPRKTRGLPKVGGGRPQRKKNEKSFLWRKQKTYKVKCEEKKKKYIKISGEKKGKDPWVS